MPSSNISRTATALIAGSCFLSGAVGAAIEAARARAAEQEGGLVAGWSQCGGYQYTGPTQCEEGFYCHKNHESYFQCWPVITVKVTPTLGVQDILTQQPAPSPEPTTPSLPPRTPDGR